VDAWAATGDWSVPLGPHLAISGEAYRGRAIAGLGQSASPSVILIGTSGVQPLTSRGGWSQVKIAPSSRFELNVAAGTDRSLRRNTTAFVNGIYLVRSNIPLSIEFRHLQTTLESGTVERADHVSVGAGIAF
jgi:hypothetical protein